MRARCPLLLVAFGFALSGGACVEHDNFMTGGGGGGDGIGGSEPDAGSGDEADAGGVETISGRVCRVDDVRSPSTCVAPVVASVRLGAAGTPVQSGADGRFTLPAGAPGDTVLLLATPAAVGFVPGASPVRLDASGGAEALELRVVQAARLDDLLASNLQADQIGRGQLVVSVRDGLGQPVTTATLSTIGGEPAYYGNEDDTIFAVDGTTGAQGFAMFFNLMPDDEATFTVTLLGMPKLYATPIVADAITFVTVGY